MRKAFQKWGAFLFVANANLSRVRELKRSFITRIMKNKTSTLRLIYPQWQGGIVAHLLPELSADDASRGYYLGAQLLNFLAPANGQKTVEVPILLDVNDRATQKGVSARNVIVKQTRAAIEILNENNPEKDCDTRRRLCGECCAIFLVSGKIPRRYSHRLDGCTS